MTYSDGGRVAAIARAGELLTVGVDAEPHDPLPDGVLAHIARPEGRPCLAGLLRNCPGSVGTGCCASAKERIYKAWFPIAERWLGFNDVVVTLDPQRRIFSARLLASGPTVPGRELTDFLGRWIARDGLLLTAIAMTHPVTSPQPPGERWRPPK